jgi:hypothetical protein
LHRVLTPHYTFTPHLCAAPLHLVLTPCHYTASLHRILTSHPYTAPLHRALTPCPYTASLHRILTVQRILTPCPYTASLHRALTPCPYTASLHRILTVQRVLTPFPYTASFHCSLHRTVPSRPGTAPPPAPRLAPYPLLPTCESWNVVVVRVAACCLLAQGASFLVSMIGLKESGGVGRKPQLEVF